MQQDLNNSSISCLHVWIWIRTYSILSGGERFVKLALCYGQKHPRYIECSPINLLVGELIKILMTRGLQTKSW